MEEIGYFSELLKKELTKEEKIRYVYNQIIKGNFSYLPSSLAENNVIKVPYVGDIDKMGFEVNYLYIPKDAKIKKHKHIYDIEKYTLLQGNLVVNEEDVKENYCLIDEEHDIDYTDEITIVETYKISKELLDKYKNKEEKELVLCAN